MYGSISAMYVIMEVALEIEQIQKEGDLRSLEFKNREVKLVRENCIPSWPVVVPLPMVYPVNDFDGMRPERVPHSQCLGEDYGLAWFLCVMVCYLPDMCMAFD